MAVIIGSARGDGQGGQGVSIRARNGIVGKITWGQFEAITGIPY